MSGFNLPEVPSTSDPRRLSDFLTEYTERLENMLMNIDEENLSDDIVTTLRELKDSVDELKEQMSAVIEYIGAEQEA